LQLVIWQKGRQALLPLSRKPAMHNEQVPLVPQVWQLLTRQTQVVPFCTCPLGQTQVLFVRTNGVKQLHVVVVVEFVVFVIITKLF
jgi:hypothetical protein